MGKFTTEFYPASILGYTVSHLKVPQFRGIFHALSMVYAKNAHFYAIIFRFLYTPPFYDSQCIICFKNVPCVILDKTKINAHIDTIKNESKAIKRELMA